jgi:hypothetical protein
MKILILVLIILLMPFYLYMPADAQEARLTVSATYRQSFFGPQVLQIDVDGAGIREPDTSPGALVVNGVNIPLVHLTDSRWVVFVADDSFMTLVDAAGIPGMQVSASGGSFWALGPSGKSVFFPSLAGAYSNDPANNMINPNLDLTGDCPASVSADNPCVEWPYIRLFSFSENDNVSFRYSSQSVTLKYIKPSPDDVSIVLDRDSYPIGAEIILTLSDHMWNINPIEEDRVHFAFSGSTSVFFQASPLIAPAEITATMGSLGFENKQILSGQGLDGIKFVNTIGGSPETILIETGPNTGVFENFESRADMLASKRDAQFRFDYFDTSTSSGMGSSDAHVSVGKEEPKTQPKPAPAPEPDVEEPVKVDPYSMSEPTLSGLLGDTVRLIAGQPVLVKTKVTNNLNEDQPFVYILQVKDSEGITEMLTWIKGTMNASTSLEPGISWTPDESGRYTVEVFVWKSLEDPGLPLTKSISVNVD